MEYIVILCYNTEEVLYKELTEDDNKVLDIDTEEFFKKYHLNIDECSWMFTSSKPKLNKLEIC